MAGSMIHVGSEQLLLYMLNKIKLYHCQSVLMQGSHEFFFFFFFNSDALRSHRSH